MASNTSRKSKTERNAENIQVIVRCRGMNKQELIEKQTQVCFINEKDKEICVQPKTNKGITKSFFYDAVYGPKSSQKEIYLGTVLPIVQEVLEGYNCTIFAYGQTGTGKTYTMEGPKDLIDQKSIRSNTEAGIITRSINTIFEKLSKCVDEYSVKVSHLEVYNEELCDLLNPDNKDLKIFEDSTSSSSAITVHNLTETPVGSADDIFVILEKSWNLRKTAETFLNHHSSRSHCIFSITIHIRESTPEGEEFLKIGKLNLVDLAGSENVGKSGAKSMAKTEAGMINKSLLTLGRVINALTDHTPHIPYRESKLTRLLQDSLGGTTKTCIIATITPASGGIDETLSTLDYAFRAKNIRNQPQVNKKVNKREVLKEYTSEITDLRAQLDSARRKDGVHLPLEHYDKLVADLTEKSAQIEMYKDMVELKNKQLDDVQELIDSKTKELEKAKIDLEQTNSTLNTKLEELLKTNERLAKAESDIVEKQMIVGELRDTESKMHEQATLVYDNLNRAITDIDGLYKKIERQDKLVNIHNEDYAQLRSTLTEQIKDIEKDVKNFVSKQSTCFKELSNKFSYFTSEKDKEFKQLENEILNFKEGLNCHIAKLDGFSLEFYRCFCSASEYLSQISKEGHKEILSACSSLLEKNQNNATGIQHNLSELKSVTTNWFQNNTEILSEVNSNTEQFLQVQSNSLNESKTESTNRLCTAMLQLNVHQNQLANFVDNQNLLEQKFKSILAEQLSNFTMQMNDVIQNLSLERQQSIESTVGTLKTQIQSTGQGLADTTGYIDKKHSEIISTTENHGKYQKEATTKLYTAFYDNQQTVSNFSQFLEDKVLQNITENEMETSQLQEEISNLSMSQQTTSNNIAQNTKGYFYNQSKYLRDFVEHTGMSISNIQGSHSSLTTSIESSAKEWSGELSSINTIVDQFNDLYGSSSLHLNHKIEQFKIKPYEATLTTPARHPFAYPTKLPQSRSDFEIVSQDKPIPMDPSTPVQALPPTAVLSVVPPSPVAHIKPTVAPALNGNTLVNPTTRNIIKKTSNQNIKPMKDVTHTNPPLHQNKRNSKPQVLGKDRSKLVDVTNLK